jgi:CheY-like chemotaxis protein
LSRKEVGVAVILVVEDETSIRELVELILQDDGYDTLSASDVGEAMLLIGSTRQIDAMFTDIHLKAAVLGGCELAERAIEIRPNLIVLYTTATSVSKTMKASFLQGSHFLPKQYTPRQLLVSVEGLLAA